MSQIVVNVVGAGLAGSEAAYTLASRGIKVNLFEQKPTKKSPAHRYNGFCELVCSNSLKASRVNSAAGLLKEEMRMLGSVTMKVAAETSVAAGGALAVDREKFSNGVTQLLKSHPLINVIEEEYTKIMPDEHTIIATGPLTSEKLTAEIQNICNEQYLSFYDAAAPIVSLESIDMEKVFFASRYDKGDADYINCPFEKDEYEKFYDELIKAEVAPLNDIDKEFFKVYEGCMPIEVMAKRGADTMRYGPLKPVGIYNPKTGKRPYAVVQLRKENKEGSLYNLVGFQTNLKFGEQKRVFSLIPGLEDVDFVRYGVMHRNTFINSPKLLDGGFRFKKNQNLYFAGQLTGVEGYMESAGSGILAGINVFRQLNSKPQIILPKTTMLGALSGYISDETVENFQPMGSNMGILPELSQRIRDKKLKYQMLADRSIEALSEIIQKEDLSVTI